MSEVIKLVKNTVMDHITIVVDSENGTPNQSWKLQYDYPSMMKCEEATGLNLLDISKWNAVVSSKHFPAVIHAGLLRHQPTLTLEEVIRVLNPASHEYLTEKLFQLLHPAAYEAWEKRRAEIIATGETADPNAVTATPKR